MPSGCYTRPARWEYRVERPDTPDGPTAEWLNGLLVFAAGLAGSNSNGGARHLQKIRKEFNASFVGFSFDRGSGERNFQRPTQFAGDGILSRTRVNFDGKGYPAGGLVDGNHEFFPSAKAVSATRSPAIRGICGFAMVRGQPMLAISAATKASIIRFAPMQKSLRPRTL